MLRKRLNALPGRRLPFASRRKQTSLPATMHSMSAAPFIETTIPNRPNDQSICASM